MYMYIHIKIYDEIKDIQSLMQDNLEVYDLLKLGLNN